MSVFLDAFAKVCQQTYKKDVAGPLLNYVLTGDEAQYQLAVGRAKGDDYADYFLYDLWDLLGAPAALTAEERRAMSAGAALGEAHSLAMWLNRRICEQPQQAEAYVSAYLDAFGGSATERVAATTALMLPAVDCFEQSDGQPNALGRFLLSLSDADLSTAARQGCANMAVMRLFQRHAPQRLPAIASSFLRPQSYRLHANLSIEACQFLLEHDMATFEPIVLCAVESEQRPDLQARVLDTLAEIMPDRYRQRARETNLRVLASNPHQMSPPLVAESFRWLLRQYREEILPEMETHLTSYSSFSVARHLDILAAELGPAGAPGMLAAFRHSEHLVKAPALAYLLEWNDPAHESLIRQGIADGLNDWPSTYIGLAGRWRPDLLQAELWKLFDHKSKPIRHAAARALARMGEAALPAACAKLAAKKAAVRSAAVTLLNALQIPAAAEALEARLDVETDEEVRDQILLALERVWETQGRMITRQEIEKRIQRTQNKLGTPLVQWLAEQRLPPLRYAGKKTEPLSLEMVRYLLYRQSRAREIRPDVEAKPLYALIDRSSSGDFALELLKQFLASDMAAEDRWALTVAALLGDDRIVPLLMPQIKVWVDKSRGKLAEYAAQALALIGTDVALCSVDALSIRYRSKNKNIGKAAGDAFAEAAERLGISVEELGDRVVPWLGFEPGRPRLLGTADKQIEVRIGPDFKLAFRDVAKGKPVKSLPASMPAAEKSEFKDLSATLREVVKGQLARLENLMVRQFRWPVERWRELYLAHPLLFPFACRLVWGDYAEDGKLRAAFRALEDQTLTNEQDEPIELADDAQIGIVHPLDLTPEQRQAWKMHLSDYDIESPFLQLERPVVFAADEDSQVRMSSTYKGVEINAMTFKGRAERLGWVRGSVIDGGGISSYRKPFPGACADAILELEGMYIGIDMYSSIKLERFYFVRTGSVTVGSYTYDEPSDEHDDRLIPFGEVPAIVYSETAGDLGKIAGEQAAEPTA